MSEINGFAYFTDTSVNNGTVSEAAFSDTASNVGTTTIATFSGNSVNSGSTNRATFSGSSVNSGNIGSYAVFTGSSVNTGTIEGGAVFADTSTNTGVVTGEAIVATTATNTGTVGTETSLANTGVYLSSGYLTNTGVSSPPVNSVEQAVDNGKYYYYYNGNVAYSGLIKLYNVYGNLFIDTESIIEGVTKLYNTYISSIETLIVSTTTETLGGSMYLITNALGVIEKASLKIPIYSDCMGTPADYIYTSMAGIVYNQPVFTAPDRQTAYPDKGPLPNTDPISGAGYFVVSDYPGHYVYWTYGSGHVQSSGSYNCDAYH